MAGYREFQTGEVLTAANVDDFLAKQSVMKFADSAARDTALGTAVAGGNALREGMVAYLDDTDEVIKYDGSAWSSIAPAVTQNFVQVVTATDATNRSTSSTSFVTGTLSASITPTAASNLIIATWSCYTRSARSQDRTGMSTRMLADGTPITGAEATDRAIRYQINVAPWQVDIGAVTQGIYTTVGTSSVSFTTEFRSIYGDSATLVNATSTGVLTLMEVVP